MKKTNSSERVCYSGRIAVSLLAAALCVGCRKVESYEKPLTPVKTKAVEQQFLTSDATRYSANIQPESQVDLAFKVGGYISQFHRTGGRSVDEGDWIRRGAVLARISDTDFAARIKQAKAQLAETLAAQSQVRSQLAEAQAAQENAKIELDRASRLFAADSLIKPDYDAAKMKFEMGHARIESVKAQLGMIQAKADAVGAQIEEAEIARKDTELRAPMDGLLLKRNVEIGSLVAPGSVAFTLADVDSVKAVFGVPDVETSNLKPGSVLNISSEALRGAAFRGTLTRISPSADSKTRVFDVEVRIPNPGRRLKAGMVVALEVAGQSAMTPVIVAPLSALLQIKEKDGGYALFVVEDEGGKRIARLRRVEAGKTLGNTIAVSGGVKAGEQVIVSGATLVSDGEEVRVIQ